MVKFLKYFTIPVFNSTLLCIFIFYSGIFSIPEKNQLFTLNQKNQIQKISGKLVSSPSKISNGKYYKSYLEVYSTESYSHIESSAKGRISVYIPTDEVEAYYPGKLYSSSKSNEIPVYESGGIYTFTGNFSKNDFYVKQCIYSMWSKSLFSRIDYLRALCRLQFKRLMYSWKDGGGLLLALLCGSKEYTNLNLSDNFRNAGLSHILALSGMHLSMFSSIALFFGKKIKRKKVSFIIRSVVLFIFVWFAGISPSLLRAYICSMLLILSSMTGTEEPDMILILCFSFLIQSIISPNDIHNVGFILSYSALAGILLFNKFFFNLYSKVIPKYLSASLSASTSAQIFTLPVSLKLFGSFSPIGIIATTVISPIITIFIYSGLILIILSLFFPFIAGYSAIFINFLYNIISFLVNLFAKVPKWSLT